MPAVIKEIVLGSGTEAAIVPIDCATAGAVATIMAMESRLRFILLTSMSSNLKMLV